MDTNRDIPKTKTTDTPFDPNTAPLEAVAAAIPEMMETVQQQGGAAVVTTSTTTTANSAVNETTPQYAAGTVLTPKSTWPPPVFMTAQSSDQERFYMEHRWHAQWSWYDKRASDAKTTHQRLQLIIGIGSVTVPVLVGFSLFDQLGVGIAQQILTVAISLAVAIASAVENVLKPGDNWRSFRAAAEELTREKAMYDVKAGPYRRTKNPFQLFTERCEDIIAKQNGQWLQMQTVEERDDDKKPQVQQTVAKAEMITPPAADPIAYDGSAG